MPADLADQSEPEALPPALVAARALRLADEGCPVPWASTFLIVRTENHRIVGSCGFKGSPSNGRVEIGYGVSPACRREGAATSAVAQLLTMAFAAGATEVMAEILPENQASATVAHRSGLRSMGIHPDREGVHVVRWIASVNESGEPK